MLLGESAKKAAQTAFSLKKNNGRAVQIKKWTKLGEADSNNIREGARSSFIIAANDNNHM